MIDFDVVKEFTGAFTIVFGSLTPPEEKLRQKVTFVLTCCHCFGKGDDNRVCQEGEKACYTGCSYPCDIKCIPENKPCSEARHEFLECFDCIQITGEPPKPQSGN